MCVFTLLKSVRRDAGHISCGSVRSGWLTGEKTHALRERKKRGHCLPPPMINHCLMSEVFRNASLLPRSLHIQKPPDSQARTVATYLSRAVFSPGANPPHEAVLDPKIVSWIPGETFEIAPAGVLTMINAVTVTLLRCYTSGKSPKCSALISFWCVSS